MTNVAYDACIRQGLSPATCDRLIRNYSNGSEQPGRFTCYDRWQPVDRSFATSIAAREMARMYGFNPPNASKLRADAAEIVEALDRDPAGVYSSKPCGEPWNWPAVACFMNWYAWLNDDARAQVRSDILSGSEKTWAYWAMRMKELCPAEVKGDPTYQGSGFGMAGTTEFDPSWNRKGLAADRPVGPTPQAWPLLDHVTGSLAAIPGLPSPCQPFPQCALGVVPSEVVEPFVDAAAQLARNVPTLSATRSPGGRGDYDGQPALPAEEVDAGEGDDESKSETWKWVAAGAGVLALAGLGYLALRRKPARGAFEVGEAPIARERSRNALPELVRTWFGPDAGQPGVPISYVRFQRIGGKWYAFPGGGKKWKTPCLRLKDTFYAQVRVNQASGKPILFPLPNRTKCPEIPAKDTTVIIDGQPWNFGFRKVAVNVAHRL